MKKYVLIFLFFTLSSCSFDNKTGIWKDAAQIPIEKDDSKNIKKNKLKKYEEIFLSKKLFKEEKKADPNNRIEFDEAIVNNSWQEEFLTETNNISNIFYNNNKSIVFKSSRLSSFRHQLKMEFAKLETPLFINNKLISYDHKGKIYVYDLTRKNKTVVYNFYKRSFKKYKKKIKLVLDNNILFAADNLGYIYSIDINSGSLLWAKNYGIPFRSNIKIIENQLILANEDNTIYSINIKNGSVNWKFGTSKSFLNNDFENSIAIDSSNKNILYLNTNGELYSINYLRRSINWVINFKNSSTTSDINLFLSQPIIIKNDNLIVSAANSLFNYNVLSSEKRWDKAISVALKPIATKKNIFLLSKNNLLICLDLSSGRIIWSKNILSHLKHGWIWKKNQKVGTIINISVVNKEINIFTNRGYLISFASNDGKILYFDKINRSGISSTPIFYDKSMFIIGNNNKLYKFR